MNNCYDAFNLALPSADLREGNLIGYNLAYMDKTITSELVWVDNPRALHSMIKALQEYDMLAVDTESNSLYAYQEQVCLIQFSTTCEDYLVDPMALDDLSALAPIFASSEIEKVFHAAEYDIICLKRDFGFTFNNIFDTMLAARILKHQQIGLGAMLECEFGITLDKRFQRANWGQRPLPDDHLAYARLDTHYLIDLRQRLNQNLHERGLSQLAREDLKGSPRCMPAFWKTKLRISGAWLPKPICR